MSKQLILKFIEQSFTNKKLNEKSKIFLEDLNLDSLEFVKLVIAIEKKFKKKLKLQLVNDISNLDLKKFIGLFK